MNEKFDIINDHPEDTLDYYYDEIIERLSEEQMIKLLRKHNMYSETMCEDCIPEYTMEVINQMFTHDPDNEKLTRVDVILKEFDFLNKEQVTEIVTNYKEWVEGGCE